MLILWINQISKDDNRKGAYKVDKNKPCKLISLAVNGTIKSHKYTHDNVKKQACFNI